MTILAIIAALCASALALVEQPTLDAPYAIYEMPDEEGLKRSRFWGLSFAGDNDYGTAAKELLEQEDGELTVEMWALPSNTTAGYRRLFSSQSGSQKIVVQQYGQELIFYVEDVAGTGNAMASAVGVFDADMWVHIACVVDRTANLARIYKNGVQVGTPSDITGMGSTSALEAVDIGRRNTNQEYFAGELGIVRVWYLARTPAQTLVSMATRRFGPATTGLHAEYEMQPGEPSQAVVDETGNGYTITRGSGAGIDASDPTWVEYKTLTSGGPQP